MLLFNSLKVLFSEFVTNALEYSILNFAFNTALISTENSKDKVIKGQKHYGCFWL